MVIVFYITFRKIVIGSLEIERNKMESQIKAAELSALRSQVNPHFLFNSLNSLRALVRINPKDAYNAVNQLSQFLRGSLRAGQLITVTLKQELESVEAYVALETLRFEDRLRFHKEIDTNLLDTHVPPMCLQHLVENAIKYGVAPHIKGGDIYVKIFKQGDRVVINVKNPGKIATESSIGSTKVGQENIRKRLELLHGENAQTLLIESEDQVIAQISIPLS